SNPKPGPPVVSISTMRANPIPPGLSQAGIARAAGAGFACAAAFGADALGAAGVVACATRIGGVAQVSRSLGAVPVAIKFGTYAHGSFGIIKKEPIFLRSSS